MGAACLSGYGSTGTTIATGASLGPSSGGTGTFDQSSSSTFVPPFSGFTLAAPGSCFPKNPSQPTVASS